MWKPNVIQCHQIHFKLTWVFIISQWLLLTMMIGYVSASAILLNRSPLSEKIWHYRPYRVASGVTYLKLNPHRQIESHSFMSDRLRLPQKDAFRIEPSDAVVESKWSQPAVESQYTSFLPTHGTQVPSTTTSFGDYFSPNAQTYLKSTNFQDSVIESTSEYADGSVKNFVTNVYKSLDSEDHGSTVTEVTITSDYKVSDSSSSTSSKNLGSVHKRRGPVVSLSQTKTHNRNNFTDTNDSHILVPSNSVFNYQSSHNASTNVSMSRDSHLKQSNALAINANSSPSPGFTEQQTDNLLHSVYTTVSPESDTIEKEVAHSTVFFDTHSSPSLPVSTVPNHVSSTPDSVYNTENNMTSRLPSPSDAGNNLSDALPSVGSTAPDRLTSGAVAGIVIAVLVCVTLLTSTVIYFLYRRYNGKCTSVVESKFNSDNCGYLDDSLRSSVYLNNHIELPKESSEEMTSLDNDSFLNSLETMTIQNYWADNTKNTKV